MVAGGQGSWFQTTSWTLVRAAARTADSDSRAALAALCQKYWQPVHVFVRKRETDPEQAKDLTQGFFALLIEKNYLADVDPERGSFRAFLLTAVKHFLANEWDRMHALKRGGGQIPVSIDLVANEDWASPSIIEHMTPERLFERRWALSVLEHAMSILRAEFDEAGKAQQFEQLSAFLNKDVEPVRYETLAAQVGLSTGALRMAVHRLRQRYRRILREEVAQTVSSPEDVEAELRFLLSALSE